MLRVLRFALLSLCLLPLWVAAAEVIEDFAVTLQVQADGNLLVTERITVQAEGEQIKRGIYRDLPVSYSLPLGLLQSSQITLLGVSRDGQAERARVEQNGSWVRYYLGSADHLLQPGRYQYELRYRVERQLLHHFNSDELYWNVTGNQWVFPILQASVEVKLPPGARIGDVAAYTGADGAQGQAYEVLEQRDDYLRLATTEALPAYHGLTVAVDWPAGLVARPGVAQRLGSLLLDNLGLCLGALLLVGLVIFYLRAWDRVGRDPEKGLIIPLFEAPQGMSAVQAGYLWHRGLRGDYDSARVLSVCFTDWAIRRLIQLKDRPRADGFVVTLGAAQPDQPQTNEREPLALLFPKGQDSKPLVLGARYERRLVAAQEHVINHLKSEGKHWFSHNRGIWAWGLFWAIAACLLMVFAGAHGADEMAGGFAGVMFTLGFGVPSLFVLRMAWQQPTWGKKIGLSLAGLMFIWPVPIGLWMLSEAASVPALLLLCVYVLVVVLFYYLLPAPSIEGRRLLDQLEGYRDYLQLAESDALALAGNAPAMSIALYEKHLPYAMALGVEDKWSARFSAALASGLIDPAQRDYQPDWYHSRSSFSTPLAMSTALAAGLSSATALASSPPSSSSSDGGGSSGGGSSGGGGGGGGGGGW
ncbi:MAG: DUF2207 domain-containing protein [Pseudomonas sp.]|uniref:DUF2207 domain-containing protein n=1 Tax=Pseudomonas sp. TaxID=306 RepID=UPI0027285D0A|nr:DUF2207 domain-containing protein [Pseudomonas sp.]MDO9619430.1 DUF2207 domain-containing protein [Pseudomonas sp.]MDP2447379.1 DUF2207 domain-containing protein [Pseudomonas sp.]MDZ4336122.1 DUF2207 domain-containing protein [Pseudomonas sp.]